MVILATWLVLACPSTPAQAKYGGGTGTAEDPYLIYTAEQMNTIGLDPVDWDNHFRLMADIDLSACARDGFNRIGRYSRSFPPGGVPFSGVFDGNGHALSKFTYIVDVRELLPDSNDYGDWAVGLFGYVKGTTAEIRNLRLIDPNVCPATTCTERFAYVGALAGRLSSGSITDCCVEGGRVSGDSYVGGLVGSVGNGMVVRCHTTCTVTHTDDRPLSAGAATGWSIGGLAGSCDGHVSHCHATGAVRGRDAVGGLVGFNSLPVSAVSDSYATGEVSAESHVGGLVGWNYDTIRDCHATGNVSGGECVGGLAGYNAISDTTIERSYARGRVSGPNFVGGLVGGNNGTVRHCYATGQVAGTKVVGGLTGFNGGSIVASYATGEVTGNDHSIGGLSGNSGKRDEIIACYAQGDVRGTRYVGGLLGSGGGTVRHCYATGAVFGKEHTGGLTGSACDAMNACFWDVETSGLEVSANGTGRTTAEMQDFWGYMLAGWDFVWEMRNGTEDVWQMNCDRPTYPKLAWQEEAVVGDFVDPEGVDFRDIAFLAVHWLDPLAFPCDGADLTFDARANTKDFAVVARSWRQGVRKVIYETTLDTCPGWTVEGQWQFGRSLGLGGAEHGNPDPVGGCTGANVYGVNLNGDYHVTVDGPQYLTAGPFDCSAYHDVELQFARWLNTDQADFVEATVQVSNDGTSWTTVWAYAYTEGELTDGAWKTVVYDISGRADHRGTLYIRWGYKIKDADAWALSGWNIDDISVFGYR